MIAQALFGETLAMDPVFAALISTLAAATTCGLLSCWLIHIGWALMGDAVSHAILPGVALGYLLGFPFVIGALVFGVGAVALVAALHTRTHIKTDAAIGVVFTALFALGLVIMSATDNIAGLTDVLFGDPLNVGTNQLVFIILLASIAIIVLLVKRHDFTLFAFDPTQAQAMGINTRALRALLLGLLAVTVVIAMHAVGVILVVAMLITPGATAALLTRRMAHMLPIAVVSACAAAVVGVGVGSGFDVSIGGCVVLAQASLFAGALGFVAVRTRVRSRRSRARNDNRILVDDA